ncbi:hypothetical protein [Variovorax sp. KK3]|uniref:hypothetical protein n=1 Tax=Variovorax sp. KK3 TaxID=1855728 RepID=UPI00097BE18B|nr:hypothetical protein [Variovorax sp. KK3]
MKPQTLEGYDDALTVECERMLVTLLRGLGPWKNSVVLVGGLTPRYLVKAKPPHAPDHAGTQDVDVVIDLQVLADVEAYHTLEGNLKKLGFERGTNDHAQKINWRWEARAGEALLRLEFLVDMPGMKRVAPLPTEGNLSALNVPHSSIAFDHYREVQVTTESLGGNGVITETVKHADLVAFTTLKAFAFAQRWERKDAHDLVYCLEHCEAKREAVPGFKRALAGKHGEAVREALGLLRKHFLDDETTEGHLKDGPVAVAKFELGDLAKDAVARALRQREASFAVEWLLRQL